MQAVENVENFLLIGGLVFIGSVIAYEIAFNPTVKQITKQTIEGLKEGVDVGFKIIDATANVVDRIGIQTVANGVWDLFGSWFVGMVPDWSKWELYRTQATLGYAIVYNDKYIDTAVVEVGDEKKVIYPEDLPQAWVTYVAERINLHAMEYEQYIYWYNTGLVYYNLNTPAYETNIRNNNRNSIEWELSRKFGNWKDFLTDLYDLRDDIFYSMLSSDYILGITETIVLPDKYKGLKIRDIPSDNNFSFWKFRDFVIRNFPQFSYIRSYKDKSYFLFLIKLYLMDNSDKSLFAHMQSRYDDKPAKSSWDVSRVFWVDEVFEKTYILSLLHLAKGIKTEEERDWVRRTVADYIRQYGGWTDTQKKALISPSILIPPPF